MPESKKRRIIEDEEEDEINTPARAAGVKRSARDVKDKLAKRSKHEESEEEQEQSMEDEDDTEENNSYREEPEGWGADEADASGDLTWKERANMEFEKSKTQRGRHGMVAEMGVIEVIEMFDFMCHRHLKVPFGPKINFIIGHNGSGKSAILTAIMVCLGGKANATNRAQSLKALIREGASQTEVKLQLRNRGPDAYKPEIFGESIIIERRISKDGTSGYKIKSSKGKTISTKREELSAICDHMNIQVDNPMNVLSQDTARQFLQSSTAEEKYNFFSRGTQLTQLSIDYEAIRECIDIIQSTLKNKTEILPELYELAKAAQARFKDSQQAATLELKVESLKNQVAWAQIEDLEKGVQEAEKSLNAAMSKIPAIEKKRAQEQQAIQKLDEKIQEAEQTASQHDNSTAPAQEQKRKLEHELREKRNELKSVQEEEKTVNDEIKALKDQVRNFDQKIEQETKKLQANTHSKRAAIEEQIQRLSKEVEQGKRRHAEERETCAKLETQIDERRSRLEHSSNAVNKAKAELNENKERIRQMKDQKQNALKAFGPTIPDVLTAIQEVTDRGGWRGESPVGPLGRHVKLREQSWAPVIESALGNVLNAFAVTVDADRSTLFQILKRYRCNSDVILTRKIIFDYSEKEPSNSFLTINRVLEFDNEWVRRLLIDKSSIESTVLIEKRAEADRVTSSGRDGGFPDNVTQCFTMDLVRVGDRGGGAASIMMNRYRGPPRLSKNVEQELQVLEGNSRRIEDSLRYRFRENQDFLKEIEKMEEERMRIKRSMNSLEKEIKRNGRSADELQDGLQEDEPANLHAYEESRQQLLMEIETWKKQYEPVALQKQAINAVMEPIKEQILELNESIKSQYENTVKTRVLELTLLLFQSDLDRLNMERQDHIPRIQHWERKLETEARTIRELEMQLQTKTKYLEESTVKATEYCERVQVTASTTQLERQIKHLQECLREQEAQRGCSLEEIAMDMTRKQDEYKAAKLAIHQLDQFVSVETEDQHSGKSGVSRDKDPKSLSGGEKSFSTICLLLALWDSMSSSIRCLDEFDVFMDAVNRRISIQMLIDTARESDGVQYILITPQDASSVSPGPDVRVHRLHDPERNQQTIR
ncbi:Structural maintenance of chromosomes protein 6 [Gamsiella multidivaricata]|nr:Structural maintenance of chromosomes protein 6 [Gamsiella multidivaricata]